MKPGLLTLVLSLIILPLLFFIAGIIQLKKFKPKYQAYFVIGPLFIGLIGGFLSGFIKFSHPTIITLFVPYFVFLMVFSVSFLLFTIIYRQKFPSKTEF